MQVLIISDPLTTTSGASLSVRVGASSDPSNLQGLAHFCEHMLFLGSYKYPNGDEYFKTVSENNGRFNAYTDREVTNYFFDIHYFSFEKALDIFSRFFIDPLFKEEKLNKEINSVNSEYEKNLIIDGRKKSQIYSFISEPDNPYNRFTTGNIETLVKSAEINGLSLKDELLKFHKKYYTSEKMKLILYTKEDLDDMEEIILDKFSSVKPSAEFLEKEKLKKNSTDTQNFMKKNLIDSTKTTAESIFSDPIKSEDKYNFISPFNKNVMGSIISFDSYTQEHELSINFLQKSLRSNKLFRSNPFLYFSFIIESREKNSLMDILKKNNYATKLNVDLDREFDNWSDLTINISLTKKGINEFGKVLVLISNYLDYMTKNFVNEKYFNYLKNIKDLRFQSKNTIKDSIYDIVSKIGARAHNYPLSYVLQEDILDGEFNREILNEYGKNLNLENSIIFIPDKYFQQNLKNYSFLNEGEKKYEPWYKTKYNFYKINFKNLNKEKVSKNNFSAPNLFEKESIQNILKNNITCDRDCVKRLKTLNTKEPNLLNKTSTFELWHKEEFTLDFNRMQLDIAFVFRTFKNLENKVYLLLLETHLKRRLKTFSTKIESLSNTMSISSDKNGIKITFTSLNDKDLLKRLIKEFSEKLFSIFKKEKLSEYNLIFQETLDFIKKEYNSQPFNLAFDYLKDNILEDYITIDKQREILKNVTLEKFENFISIFEKKLYFKFLFSGFIDENTTKDLFSSFKDIISLPVPAPVKKIFSIKEKRLSKEPILRMDSGNYLIRKLYHGEKNKNNCLLKCYKVEKKNYKAEVLTKLFHGIIGNIIFRELRINKQFGYIARSKIDIFNNYIVKIFY